MAKYTSTEEMAARLGVPPTSDSMSAIALAVGVAEAGIELWCGRRFTLDTVATTRSYLPSRGDPMVVLTDDISSTSGLVVADVATASYASTDYQLEPLNGIGPGGTAWPYERVRLLATYFTRSWNEMQATVLITAKWGWPTIPGPVQEASRILAGDLWNMKDNKFGIAGFGEVGVYRIKANPVVQMLLTDYRRIKTKLPVA